MSSAETLKLNFHPSSLLTIGDLLAFVRRLTDTGGDKPEAVAARSTGPIAEKPPSMREQMALCSSVISRVPQRCADSALSALAPTLPVPPHASRSARRVYPKQRDRLACNWSRHEPLCLSCAGT